MPMRFLVNLRLPSLFFPYILCKLSLHLADAGGARLEIEIQRLFLSGLLKMTLGTIMIVQWIWCLPCTQAKPTSIPSIPWSPELTRSDS